MNASFDKPDFLYLSEPIYGAIYRHLGCVLCFSQPVPERLRERLVRQLPYPLQCDQLWSPSILYVGTDNWLEADLRIAYNAEIAAHVQSLGDDLDALERLDVVFSAFDIEPTRAEFTAFCEHFERWLQDVHALAPLSFVYTTDLIELERFARWRDWSVQEIPARLLPRLQRFWQSREMCGESAHKALPAIVDKASQSMLSLFLAQRPALEPLLFEQLTTLVETIVEVLQGHPVKPWKEGFLQDLLELRSYTSCQQDVHSIKTRKIIA